MRPHHRTTAIVLTLVAVVFAVFFRTLESGFLRWDDDINVFENPHVHGLTSENLRWMFTDFEQAIRYKPLSWLAWAIVHEVFGLNPFGYHLANVLLHCANTVLVFLLIRRVLSLASSPAPSKEVGQSEGLARDACATLGALLWAVHPLRVEPVAWVTGLPYGLALMFVLTATLFYLRVHSACSRKRDYWLSVGSFGLAVLSYPIVLGFVGALLALDLFPLRRFGEAHRTHRILIEKIPYLVLSFLLVAGTVYGRFHFTGSWDRPVSLDNFPPVERAMQAFYLWGYYAWKPLLPLELCPVYPVLMESRFSEIPFLLSAIGVLTVSGLLFAKRLVWPAAAALWFAHLTMLVPMLGLTERPHYPHDRYGIINGILWSVAMSGLLWKLARARLNFGNGLAAVTTLVLVLGVMTWRQTAIWHSDRPFFSNMASKLRSPHYRSQALMKLGNAQADLGDDDRAVVSYHEALQLSPSSATFHLHLNLGNALARLAQWPEAIASYETALRFKPDSASAALNLGRALAAKGELDRASETITRAVLLNPQSADTHALLAEVLSKQGKPDEARRHAAEAERLRKAVSQ